MNRLTSYFINEENNQPAGKNNSKISSPANNSLQQSFYIAAIATFTGHEGLQSPVTDTYQGEAYTFDFFCPDSEHLFKVLRLDELGEYDKYAKHPGEVNIIIDVERSDEFVFSTVVEERSVIILPREFTDQLHMTGYTILYCDRQLWEFHDIVDGLGFWRCMIPVVLLEEEDEEG